MAPEPAIQTVTLEDQNLDVGGALSDGNAATDGPNIIQASNAETLPQDLPVGTDPADVPVPPAPVAIEIPAPDAPAADAVPAGTTLPAGTETTTVAASQIPVQHLPSPSSPPPGTSDEPIGPATNANVSYLKGTLARRAEPGDRSQRPHAGAGITLAEHSGSEQRRTGPPLRSTPSPSRQLPRRRCCQLRGQLRGRSGRVHPLVGAVGEELVLPHR